MKKHSKKKLNKNMMEYYIMMIDGKCVHVLSDDKISAFKSAAVTLDYATFDDFLNDVNICEWKSPLNRIVEWYADGKIETVEFDRNSDFQLAEYCIANIQDKLNEISS